MTLAKKEQDILIAVTCLALLMGWFLNLGSFPLKLEEPRRALVALEMVLNNEYIVPTVNDVPYYKKPPLFNWALIGSFRLFGDYSEFSIRFVTVCSFIVLVVLVGWVGMRYVSREFGWLLALLTATCVDFLFYATIYAEIDVFYALITVLGFLSLFHFYQQKNFYALFLGVYLFGALGTLTKSLPSLAFLACSLTAWFLYHRDWKRLFSLSHLSGILLYTGIIGMYLIVYEKRHSLEAYLQTLFHDSSERTLVEQGWSGLFSHLFSYPIEVLKGMLPGSLLLIFFVRKRKELATTLRENQFILFSAVIVIANFWLYWISPGARLRYVFMLFPFILAVFLYSYQKFIAHDIIRSRVFSIVTSVLIGFGGMACLVLPFVPQVKELPWILTISWTLAAGVAVIFRYQRKRPENSLICLVLVVALFRVLFDVTVLPVRSKYSDSKQLKDIAYEVAELTKGDRLCVTEADRMHLLIPFYLTRERQEILACCPELDKGYYYLVDQKAVDEEQFTVHYGFVIKEREYLIVTLKPDTGENPVN